MKKIIIAIISAMIMMPTMAEAQIKKSNANCESIRSFGAKDVDLVFQDGSFILILATTDKYGKYQYTNSMKILLGNTKEQAVESLSFLEETSKTINKWSFILINDGVRDYQLYWSRKGWRKALRIFSEGLDGCTSILRRDIIDLKYYLLWSYK